MPETDPIRVLALNCTLKRAPEPSSTHRMLELLLQAFRAHGADGPVRRVVDHAAAPGVSSDEGGADREHAA